MSISSKKRVTAVDVLMNYLEREGVEYLFGVPGAALTPIYEHIFTRGRIKAIVTKHEEGAAFMAASYAWVRRGLGVCCATTGSGATNALTGIASAYADSLPIVLLTGQSSRQFFAKGAFQESTVFGIDIVEIFRPVTKLSVMVPTAERLPEIVQHAIRVALAGRPGPVHINLPADILKDYIDVPWSMDTDRHRAPGVTIDRQAVAVAAEVLAGAAQPAILAGHGVNIANASSELFKMATELRMPVATTPKAKGVFPEDHPLSLGVFGFAGHPRAEAYLLTDRADVLLVIGTSLGEWTTNAWNENLRPSRGIIQVDIDPTMIGRNYPINVGVVGDAGAALRELHGELQGILEKRKVKDFGWDEDPLSRVRADFPRYATDVNPDELTAPMKPQQIIYELQSILPEDALIFVDIGNAMTWAGHYLESRRPNTYFVSMGLASMGSAVAGAIGGKLAAPDKVVVAIVGDGAFAMNGMEVHTAVDNGIAVIWIVLNNGGHGMIMHGERLLLGQSLTTWKFRVPIDHASIGAAVGARSFRVESGSAFREAMQKALWARVPCVIDALIDPEEVPCSLARRARTMAASFEHLPLSMRRPSWPTHDK